MKREKQSENGEEKKKKSQSDLVTKESLSAVCALFLLFATLVLCTRDVIFGSVGVAIFHFIMGVFGYAAYPIVLLGLYGSVTSLFGIRFVKNRKAATSLAFALIFLTLILHVALTQDLPADEYLKECWAYGESFSTATVGGVAFGAVAFGLISITKPIGAILIFACFFLFACYLFVISVKKTALFHKKPVLEEADQPQDNSPAVIVEGEPLQETTFLHTGNGQAYANGYTANTQNRQSSQPVTGGMGYGAANAPQRPAFMIEDGIANGEQRNSAPSGVQTGQNGFSPFAYDANTQQNQKEKPTQINEDPQSGRAYLFGLDPAESYRRNLIFDQNANVNKRRLVNDTPIETGRNSAYTPSYLNDYENSVNEATSTQNAQRNGFGRELGQYDAETQNEQNGYTLREYPEQTQQPAQAPVDEYIEQETRESQTFRTGFGVDTSETWANETTTNDSFGGRQGFDRGFDNDRQTERNDYELNVNEDRYGAESSRGDEYTLRNENEFERGFDSPYGRDNDTFAETERDGGYGRDENGFERNDGFDRENTLETPASRFDGGFNSFDEDRGRSDGFEYSSFAERGGDGYELRGEDDDRGDGSAFRIFDDETESLGRGEDAFDERENNRFLNERDDREDDGLRGGFGFENRLTEREETPVQKPAEKPVEKPAPPPKPRMIKPYVRVPIDMFDCRDVMPDSNEVEVARTKEIIIETLGYFKVNDATISSVTFGPTVTRYNVVVPRNIAAKKVVALDQEIALNLQAKEGVNIYPNFEDGAVSIEVPNRKRQFVQLGCMLTGDAYVNAKPNSLTFSMGKDVGNRKVYGDICKMIHLLVAGSSGSGKSVFLGSLIISLITKYSPSELRLILIDPKKTEFVLYNDLPHLMINEIITDVNKAIQSLNWAIGEMNRRYTLFEQMSRAGTYVVNIDEYNAHIPEGEEKLPKIVVIIDELADLMLASKKEVEDRIQNLTQKARAAGIHLIVATQRPSADVITGVIKGNLPTRIAFAVASDVDSRVILDQTGAQKLLGKGDFLYTMSGVNTPVRVQSAFSSSEESQNVIRYIKMNNEAYFDESATAYINNARAASDDSAVAGEEGVEEAYIEALRCVIMAGNASISMIQRKCGVGYNRAGKIIEWMEEMGYISAFDGAKARKVLITKEEFVNKYGPF